MGECVLDSFQATYYLMRAGTFVTASVAECSRFELRTGALDARYKCAKSISGVINAFSTMAHSISYSCLHCAFWKDLAPACAGASISLISALSQIAAAGSNFQLSCGHK